MGLLDGLISYWKMDENPSGNRADSQGSNTLSESGGVGSVLAAAGVIGNAAAPAGSSYLSHASNADLQTGDIDFTFNCWMNLNTLASFLVALSKSDSAISEYILFYHQSNLRFDWQVSPDGTASTTVEANTFGAPSTGTWYMLTCWHDATANQIGIAVNAGTADTAAHTTGVFTGSATFAIGANFVSGSPANLLNGAIDEVGFWKRVLTSGERTSLYNGGAGLAYGSFTSGGGAPTLSAAAVPSAGTTLAATLSQSGCIPTSGTGGFTLAASGGAVAVSSWAISGTTLTLTLSRTIGAGETVTYSYDRATTTDDISDAGGTNFLANFSGASVTNNSTALAPGVVSLVSSGPGSAGIVVTATEATGGTGPYAHQWEVSDNGGAFGNATNGSGVSGATTLTLTFAATTAVVGHKYQFRLKYTDAVSAVVRSGATTDLIVYTGGALTGGGSRQGILTGGRL